MSDAAANCTLELACTVGSVADALEALEDGAEINFGGGAPLFTAIFNRNPEVIRLLIEQGADLSHFIPPAKMAGTSGIDDVIERLMSFAPPDPKAIDPTLMAEFDAMLRKSGLGKSIENGDWEEMVCFAEKLERIGATRSAVCVNELLDLLRPAWSFGTAALLASIKAGKKKIAALSDRYKAAGEDIENLATAFLGQSSVASGAMAESGEDRPEISDEEE